LDGDGWADLAIGAPLASPGRLEEAGSVALISSADGRLLERLDGAAAGDQFGFALVWAPGRGLFVGAPRADASGLRDAGEVVHFDERLRLAVRWPGPVAFGGFGSALAARPAAETGLEQAVILVGAPGISADAPVAGTATLLDPKGNRLAVAEGPPGSGFGSALDIAPGPWGSRLPAFIVGAPWAENDGQGGGAGGGPAGAAYVFGARGQPLAFFAGPSADAQFGASVASGPDLDGDGIGEIVVGAPGAQNGQLEGAGTVRILSPRGELLGRIDGQTFGGHLGREVLATGDLDADGADDLAVFTPGSAGTPAGSTAFYLATIEPPLRPRFHRGDPNGDGATEIGDAVRILFYLFVDGRAPGCLESADADNDGVVRVGDAIALLGYLFLGAAPPAPPGAPGAPCGEDPDPAGSTGDLGCAEYPACR
jgi:hypothetical protein